MKRVHMFFLLSLLCVLSLTTQTNAQISKGGIPPSFTNQSVSAVFDVIDVPAIDINAVMQEDATRPGPLWAGRSLQVDYNMSNSGTWTVLPDGSRIWRVKFTSTGAKGLAVVYNDFYIPDGGKLFLYNETKNQVIGAYTSENNPAEGTFSTELIQGQTVTLEYVEPMPLKQTPTTQFNFDGSIKHTKPNPQGSLNENKPSISISEIVYMYRESALLARYDQSKQTGWGTSQSCQVNVNCSPAGDSWQDEKRGVAEIWLRDGGSWGWCSGSLVNNTFNNGNPYFLTANHCGGSTATSADLLVWQFYFKYEAPSCTNPAAEPAYSTITGCTFKATGPISGGSDFFLVLLNTTPPSNYNPYYNGWDRTNTAWAANTVGIHHPSGDIKKISYCTSTLVQSSPTIGGSPMATNSAWRVTWGATGNGTGVTEGGSSGSPLFNTAGRQVGTLSGGSSDCANPTSGDYYGAFWYHWDQNPGGTTTQLKTWLDPAGTNPTTLNGFDPNANTNPPVANFSADRTSIVAGEQILFTDLSTNVPTSWSWSFTGGYPATSTLRNPSVRWVVPGTYTVTLTATNAYGSDPETKTAYITVTAYTSATTTPITIGSGTTGAVYPLGSAVAYERSAAIYTSAEITRAGFIDSLGWYTNTATTTYRPIRIYLKHTASSTLSAGTWSSMISGATLVYQDSLITSAGAWKKLLLQNDFYYNGTNNLLVMVEKDPVSSTFSNISSSGCRYTASTSRHETWASATSAPSGNGTVGSNRPNLRISFKQFATPVANFAGLNNTFAEDFEGATFPPTGWTIVNNDGSGTTWDVSTSYNHTFGGLQVAAHLYENTLPAEDGYLITPQIINIPAGAVLEFWSYNGYPTYYVKNSVLISTTGTALTDFTEVWSPASVQSNWNATQIDLSSYAGQNIYIAFRYEGNDADDWYVDDVSVSTFNYTQINTYEGDPLNIYDRSTGNPTVWNWTTTGGTPAQLSTQNASLTYYVAGQYPVSLNVGNPLGTNTKNVSNYVNVIGRAPIAIFQSAGNLKTIGYEAFIPPGATVNFTDMSSRVPTSWSWTLTGGTPASSTSQNTSSTFSTAGSYPVSLSVTNNYGNSQASDTVRVAGTRFVTNWLPDDDIAYYGYTNGLIPGHCSDANGYFYKWAEFYQNSYPGVITRALITVAKAAGVGKTVTFTVWDGSTGVPGTILGSKTMNITDIDSSAYNLITFTNPIAVTGNFFIGYELNYDGTHNYTTHQFCPFMASFRSDNSTVATAWCSYGAASPGTWYSMESLFGVKSSIAIEPEFTYTLPVPPDANFIGTPTTVTTGNSVVFNDLSTQIPTQWSWTFNGGTPSTSTQQNPSIVYNTPGVYTVSLIATNAYGPNTETKTGYITVNPPPTTLVNWDFPNATDDSIADGGITANLTKILTKVGTATPTFATAGATTRCASATSWATGANLKCWQTEFTTSGYGTITLSSKQTGNNNSSPKDFKVQYKIGAGGTWTDVPNTILTLALNSWVTATANLTDVPLPVECDNQPSVFLRWIMTSNTGIASAGVTATRASYIDDIIVKGIPVAAAPVANFSGTPTSVCAGSSVAFTDLSTNTPLSWSWTFTGGTPAASTSQNPTITYSTPGTYTVELTATNASGSDIQTNTNYITVNAIPTITATTPASRCGTGTVALGATASAGTVNWYTASTGGAAVATGTSYTTPSISATTTYYVDATSSGCTTASRTAVVATVNTVPTITATTPASRCDAGTVTLGATASAGTVNWYTASTGGASVATGTSYTTPSISTTTSYYVDATNNGCTTASRTVVVATVNLTPTITGTTPAFRCGTGTVALGATASAGTVNWYTASTGGASVATGTSYTTPSITATTSYYVDATNGGCTTASRTVVTATVNAVPTITVTTPASRCGTGTVSLGATASAGSVNWYTASTGGTAVATGTNYITPSIATTTTYYVDATSSGCTTASRTAVVATVNTVPTITATTPASRCDAGTVTLGATASAGTVNWYTASTGGASVATGTSYTTPSISTTTSYYVDATNAGCTTAARTVVVATINTTPTITATAPASRCGTGTVALGATASAGTVNWYTVSTGGASVATGTSYTTPSITATTSYYVDATNGGCTTASRTVVTATVNTIPTITATIPASRCGSGTVSLGATASAGSVNWYTASTGGAAVATGTSYTTPSISTTTSYYVDATNTGCTTASRTVVVATVNQIPSASATPASQTICSGATSGITLNSTVTGTTYSWTVTQSGVTGATASSGGTIAQTLVNSGTTAGTATYTVTPVANSCTGSTINVVVTANPIPSVTATPASQTICSGTATSISLSSSVTGTTFSWTVVQSGVTGASASSGGTIAQTLTNSGTTAGTATYTVTPSANSCTGSASNVVVTVNPIPSVTATPASQTICSGSATSIALSSNVTGATFAWTISQTGVSGATASSGATIAQTLSATGASSGTATYTVTPTANSCSGATTNAVITVNPLPSAAGTITGTATVCQGQTGVIYSVAAITNATGYTWTLPTGATISAGNNTNSITVSYSASASSGNIIVTGTNACGNGTVSANYAVTVNTTPVANAGTDQTICNGQSATLTASGGTSYAWSNGAGTASTTVSPVTTNTYTVTVTSNGCSATDAVIVNVNALPTANAGTDQTICNGQSATLTATGGTSYTWSNGAGTASTTVSPVSTTTYTVTVTDGNGCSATDAVIVNVNTLPTANAGTDQSICGGQSVTLTATGGITYSWSNGANTASTTVTPVSTTTYTVTATDANGCSATDAVIVTVVTGLTANAGTNTTIPWNTSTTLSGSAAGGSGNYSYLWSPSGSLVDATVQNPTTTALLTTTVFTLTVTDNTTTCTATSSVTVSISGGTLTATASATPGTICSGNSSQLAVVASGGSGSYTYSWSSSPAGFTSTSANPNVSPTVTTTYTVTVDDGSTTTTASTSVTVNALPTAYAGADAGICTGSNTTLTATGGTSYVWNTGDVTAAIIVSPLTNTTYTVTVTGANGCSATDNVLVAVNPLPTANAGSDQTICEGQSTTLTATGGVTYGWSNGDNTASATVAPVITTTYNVTVTDINGCSASDAVVVNVNAAPVASAGPNQSVCVGSSATLTATGGVSYAWSSGDNTVSTTVTPAVTTSYTVTVTGANTCTATSTVQVTVNTLPTADAGSDQAVCSGFSAILTATGGVSYAWSSGDNTASTTVTPVVNTNYTVTVTDVNGCVNTDVVIVTVNNLPTANAGADQTVCSGQSASLTATGGTSYTWSSGGSGATIVVTPTGTTSYTVTVTDVNGCSSTDAAIVTVNALPVANAGTDQSICNGQSASLTATGGVSYSWSTGATTSSISVTPTTNTTYSVVVTDVNNCSATDAVIVTVNSLPGAYAGSDQTVCSGTGATLTATGGVSYAWNSGDNTATATVSPVTTSTYTVTVTGSNGCSATDNVVVNVNALPTASAGADQNICAGQNASLTASGGTLYNWSNGGNTATIIVSPSATTLFTVTVTDANGCSATAVAMVNVTNAPTVSAGTDQTISYGSATTLNGSVSGGSGNYTYSWSPSTSLVDAGVQNPTTVNLTSTVPFTLNVTDNVSTCQGSANVTVFITGGPLSATASVTPGTICSGAGVQLNVVPSGGTGSYSYSWVSTPSGFTASTANPTATPTISTTYDVTVSDGITSVSSSVNVVVNANPTANAGNDVSVCLNSGTILSATGGISYTWNTGDNSASITVNPASTSTYTVTVTDANGCSSSDAIIVTVNPLPSANAGSDQTICNGTSATLLATGGVSYNWDEGSTSATITVSPAVTTSYTVTVTDANNCPATDLVVVNVNQSPTASAGTDQTIGYGSNAALSGSASGGSGNYGYTWSPASELANANVQNPTTNALTSTTVFTLIVTDNATGCSGTANVTVFISGGPLSASASVSPAAICAGASAQLEAVPSGGTGTYSYSWSSNPAGFVSTIANPVITPTATTTYTVTVDDGNSNVTATAVITVNALPIADAGADQVINTGSSATLTVTGGTSYAWSTGESTALITVSPVVTTNYSVTVTDGNGCSATDIVLVTVNSAINVVISATNVACGGGNDGAATANTTGGTQPYTYNWSNSGTTQTVTGLTAGIYSVTVTDFYGATGGAYVTITEPSVLSVAATATDVTCNGMANGTATTNATGGTSPYTYTWDTQSGATISNLAAGTYNVTATDANGCSATASTVVAEPAALTLTYTATGSTGADGAVDLTVSGGSLPYSFAWSNSATTEDLTGLSAGTYTVTVTDNNGCQNSLSVIVNDASCAITAVIAGTDVTCAGGSTGAADLTVTGGTLPFTFNWSNGASTEDLTNLNAGAYSVTVTDANSCIANASVTISEPSALTLSTVVTDVVSGNDGAVDLTVSGGSLPYSFNWSNSAATEDLFNLSAGTYSVTVTDINGCFATISAIVSGAGCNLSASIAGSDASCNGSSDGSANLTLTGAALPVTFTWSNGVSTEDITNLTAGSYSVTATDANGCSANASVVISEPAILTATATATAATCGNSDGSALLTITGGTLAYTFIWSDGSTAQDLTGVAAGSYSVTVTDANGCTTTTSAVISNSGAPAVSFSTQNPSCFGTCDGNVFAMATGGTAPYTYTWAYDNHNGQFATNLCEGSYILSVTDNNSCLTIATADVTNPSQIVITSSVTPVTCGNADGAVTVSVTGGAGSYTYNWSTGATSASISGLTSGDYTVTVQDVSGCSAVLIATVNTTGSPVVSISASDATCFNTCNGAAFASASGGTAPVTFSWSNGQTGSFATNLCNGTYTLDAQDATGCMVTSTVVIGSPAEITATSIVTDESIAGATDGMIALIVSGGTGNFTFQWGANTGNQTTATASNLSAGIYTVTITDGNCSITLTDTVGVGTGITIAFADFVDIYPNPTTGILNISTNSRVEKAELTDVVGRTIVQVNDMQDHVQFDMGNLVPGIYVLNVKTRNSTFTRKIVLKD